MNKACQIGVIVGLLGVLCRAGETPAKGVLPQMPKEDRPLAERFAEPPPSARILRILHKQQDQQEAQDKALQQLAGQG